MTAKVSVKSVIEAGLEKGSSVKVILAQVGKKCPDSVADEKHVRFYANKMVREGNMDSEVAQKKYGCGTRGRKASTTPAKKAPVKKAPVKKAPVKKAAPTKKRVASKKSGNAKSRKA